MTVENLRAPTFVGDTTTDLSGGRFRSLDGITWVSSAVHISSDTVDIPESSGFIDVVTLPTSGAQVGTYYRTSTDNRGYRKVANVFLQIDGVPTKHVQVLSSADNLRTDIPSEFTGDIDQ